MDPELEEDDTTCEATEGTLSQTGVLSLVWRKDVLGAAWVESSSSVLKFCQVADPAPDFRVMQSLKYSLDPTLIVTPSTSDPDYLDKLGGTQRGISRNVFGGELQTLTKCQNCGFMSAREGH